MLDLIHAIVREAIESKYSAHLDGTFKAFKEGIELIQDSARRAVKAAGNIVHAYNLNMKVPKTPQWEHGDDILPGSVESPEGRRSIFY